MEQTQAALPAPPAAPAVPTALEPPLTLSRKVAAVEVALVSGIPTHVSIALVLVAAGVPMNSDGTASFTFFALLSLIDTVVILALISLFLAHSGETPRHVFLGWRPIGGEVARGLALLPFTFAAVMLTVVGLRAIAPWLHTVAESPLDNFMRSPLETAIFLVVAIFAGGVREELQRAFVLHRFGQRLWGTTVGLVVFTLLFGALHADQGADVAIAVGGLGLLWGLLYLRRGSAIMPMANHASFNAAQVVQYVIAKSLGA